MKPPVVRFGCLAGTALLLLTGCAVPGAFAPTPTVETTVEIVAPRVVADGRIVPIRSAELRFLTSGVVEAILVEEGQTVAAGAPLVRLDSAEFEVAVDRARAALDEARAQYDLLREPADPEAVAAAEAQLAQAEALARQTRGRVTSADVKAARDELTQARALLARLLAGARGTEVEQARAALAQARANLEAQRATLSAAKLAAETRLSEAANALRDAQDAYSRIYWENIELEKLPGELPQARRDAEAAARRAVENGEAALAQAQVDLERAREAERSGLAAAEAQVREAAARLEQVLAGADADQIAAARARVSAAEAALARLTGEGRAGEVEAAEAAVAQARAALEQLTTPPRTPELAAAEARVRAAQAALRQAELTLQRATLTAPFAGTVVQINLKIGEQPAPGEPAVVLADFSGWRVETSDLTELDVVNVRVGDRVTLTFDALPDLTLPGTVTKMQALGRTYQGDVIYTVTVEPQQWDERLRWNMTATVTIEGD
ncbi:MAG: HlyD family efflux transporter periplasmic adaptor subunit [Chloroflexaceae bacterium]|nr:HlyD family efflux transporter periplasmic adaptor subunit [Chloroflexaceae bacterium]